MRTGFEPYLLGCLQGPGPTTLAYQQPESIAVCCSYDSGERHPHRDSEGCLQAWQRDAEVELHHLDVIERTPEELCFDTLVLPPRYPTLACMLTAGLALGGLAPYDPSHLLAQAQCTARR